MNCRPPVEPVVVIDPGVIGPINQRSIMVRGRDVGYIHCKPGHPEHGKCRIDDRSLTPEELILIGQTVREVVKERKT